MVFFEVQMSKNSAFQYVIGDGGFVGSFFDTVTVLLEKGQRGSVYPHLCDLYNGEAISVPELTKLDLEVKDVKLRLRQFAPSQSVWDMEDRSATPPWGTNISTEITDLSNYFITARGDQLFDVFFEAINHAIRINTSIKIVSSYEMKQENTM